MAPVKPQQLIALGLRGWERAKHETDTDVQLAGGRDHPGISIPRGGRGERFFLASQPAILCQNVEGQLNARLQDTRIHGELIFGRELAFSGPGTEMEAKMEEVRQSCLLKKNVFLYTLDTKFSVAQIFEIVHLTLIIFLFLTRLFQLTQFLTLLMGPKAARCVLNCNLIHFVKGKDSLERSCVFFPELDQSWWQQCVEERD